MFPQYSHAAHRRRCAFSSAEIVASRSSRTVSAVHPPRGFSSFLARGSRMTVTAQSLSSADPGEPDGAVATRGKRLPQQRRHDPFCAMFPSSRGQGR